MRTNDKTNWLRRLDGEIVSLTEGEPDYGFYRIRTRDRNGFQAVAYWYSTEGNLRCRIDGKDLSDDLRACELWLRASESPITHELYLSVLNGGTWPDLSEAVTLLNNAPADDSLEGIMSAIDALKREAEVAIKKGAAKTKDEADVAADLADRLGKLERKADAAREAEKRPHLQAGRDVDDKWRPVIAAAGIYTRLKQIVCKPFLDAQRALKEKAEAEARRVAAEAAQKAREAEEQARLAAEAAARSGNQAAEAAAARAAEAAQSAVRQANDAKQGADDIAAQRVTVGTRGRAVHLRAETIVTIEDRAAVLAYFADRQEITELLLDLAKKAAKAGITVPGVKIDKGSKAA